MTVLERVSIGSIAQGAVPPGYTFTRSTAALYVDSDGLLKSAAINTPRRQWDATNRRWGYLAEPGRTNLLTYSEQFDNASWTKAGATITADQTASPDSTSNGDLLTSTATGSTSQVLQNFASTAAAYTCSVFVKQGTASVCEMSLVDQGTVDNRIRLTFATGVVSVVGGSPTANVLAVGGGWYRISLTYTFPSIGAADTFSIIAGAKTASVTGETIYVYGAQLEAGPAPSSYIPTTTVAVTRGADLLKRSLTAGEGTALSAQGTMVVEFSYLGGGSGVSDGSRVAMSCDDGTSNNAHIIYNGSGTAGRTTTATSAQGTIVDGDAIAVGSIVRAAYAWNSGRLNLAVDGVAGTADTTTPGGMPVVTTLGIGLRSAGGNTINGLIYGWTIYDDAKTDAELQALTTPTTNRNQSRLTLGLGLGL